MSCEVHKEQVLNALLERHAAVTAVMRRLEVHDNIGILPCPPWLFMLSVSLRFCSKMEVQMSAVPQMVARVDQETRCGLPLRSAVEKEPAS